MMRENLDKMDNVGQALSALADVRQRFTDLCEACAALRRIKDVYAIVSDETLIRQIRGQDALNPTTAFSARVDLP